MKRNTKPAATVSAFSFTVFPDLSAQTMRPTSAPSFAEFAKQLAAVDDYPSKKAMPLLCPMQFDGSRTKHGALRHNDAVTAIHGACGDHDASTIPLAEAERRLKEAGVEAVLYTSPSHTEEKPRWRVVVPFKTPTTDQEVHRAAVEKLNHIFGGMMTSESFTLSQSYYFGRVEGADYRTVYVEGAPIDTLNIPRAPKVATKGGGSDSGAGRVNYWVDQVITGANVHESMRDLVAHLIAKGETPEDTRAIINGLVMKSGRGAERINAALGAELDRAIQGAVQKYAPPPVPASTIGRVMNELRVGPAVPNIHTEAAVPDEDALRALLRNWNPKDPKQLITVPEPDFYVDSLVMSHLSGGIVSQGNLGKTSLMIDLGITTALGTRWLGMKVKEGSFVLLSLDDPQEDLDAALALMLIERRLPPAELEKVRTRVRLISLRRLADDISFTVASQYGQPKPSGIERAIVDALSDIPNLRCVVVDTLRQFAGGTANDDRVVTIATKAVTRITDQLKCAAIIAHHMTKEGARSGIHDQYAGSGSGAFGDNLRFILNLVEAKLSEVEAAMHIEPHQRISLEVGQILKIVDARGSLLRKKLLPFYVVRDGFRFTPVAGQHKTAAERESERYSAILKAINGGATAMRPLRDEVGGKMEALKKDVDAMLGARWIMRKTERSPLELTPAGLARIGGSVQ